MDIVDVFTSSDEEENHHNSFSDTNRDNTSTDIQRSTKHGHKTKNIKKKYESIQENGKVYHYEDDPQEYRRIRKKVQNRLSARRVRGRKQNAFESLQQEVDYLRNANSELLLTNARLQTQNKGLKQQLDFMKGLVKPQNSILKPDPIQKYLSPQTLNDHSSSATSSNDFESPFMDQESDWLRLPNRRSSSNTWAMLAVFTLVLAVFILPSETSTKSATVLFSVQGSEGSAATQKTWIQLLISVMSVVLSFTKSGLKYLLTFCYIWFLYFVCEKYMRRKKMKKV